MKEQDRIPVTKVQRASKFLSAGAKVGTNYLKHYGKKLINPDLTTERLHQDNAKDIYDSLSELKGGALKVAQMLSMDKNLLPTAYQQKFAMAQYSAPPLSYPLVVKTFMKYFGKTPDKIFDTFTTKAVNAASMGQVHQATLGSKTLAVKIQYPGVGDSVKSDLAMVKPIALAMFKLNPIEYNEFIQEVESRMLEETDYQLELERSMDLSTRTKHLKNILFPTYYPEYSSAKILTMDWLDGKPLGQVVNKLPQEEANKLGQAMWDFYHFQMHTLKAVHADPHPGNFIITKDYKLGIIDFGCVKEIPNDFYDLYFQMMDRRKILDDEALQMKLFSQLRFIYPDDTLKQQEFFRALFVKLIELLSRPFRDGEFDFADKSYFEEMFAYGEKLSTMKELRDSKKARGVSDAVYINRTYFGLYTILHDMKAKIKITQP
ncbi:MAG: AarF/UbiB family protein [Chryseolinea sp.]